MLQASEAGNQSSQPSISQDKGLRDTNTLERITTNGSNSRVVRAENGAKVAVVSGRSAAGQTIIELADRETPAHGRRWIAGRGNRNSEVCANPETDVPGIHRAPQD